MRTFRRLQTARFFSLFFAWIAAALLFQSLAFSSHQVTHIAQSVGVSAPLAAAAHAASPADQALREENCALCGAFRTTAQPPRAAALLTEHFAVQRIELEISRIKLAQLFRLRPPSRAPPRFA